MSEGLIIWEGARVVMWWALSTHLVKIELTDLPKTAGHVPPPLVPTGLPLQCACVTRCYPGPCSLFTCMPLFNQALQTHDFYTVVSKRCHKMDVLEAALMETLNTPTLSLKLENPYRTFRTAREIEKDGHGNYISGVIEFNPAPKSDEVIVKSI
jgi:hypothetical protein